MKDPHNLIGRHFRYATRENSTYRVISYTKKKGLYTIRMVFSKREHMWHHRIIMRDEEVTYMNTPLWRLLEGEESHFEDKHE